MRPETSRGPRKSGGDEMPIADKYIAKDGGAPTENDARAMTYAEEAWCKHAETVHRYLRARIGDPEARAAIAALESIGISIALDERKAKKDGEVTRCPTARNAPDIDERWV